MKKIVIINASPRKNFNTAKLLQKAQEGAEANGAEIEYFNLYDYNFKGCMSCFACKVKNNTTNGLCAIKDDLRPILEKCINADAIILGTPVYFSYPTGMFRSFLERLAFAAYTYMIDPEQGGTKRILDKIIPTGIIFTMNCPHDWARDINYPTILNENVNTLRRVMGYAESLWIYDTYQFADYSKYDCDLFDEEHKRQVKENQFPKDLEHAYKLGSRFALM